MPKGGWPATERRSGLAFSYRRWLTVEPSRKPTSKAKGRPQVRLWPDRRVVAVLRW